MSDVLIERTETPPAGWLDYARRHGEFYHDPRWLEALRQAFGFRAHCLTAVRGGQIEGSLALCEVPALFGPRRLVSLPFSYAAGPLAASADIDRMLVEEAVQLAKEQRVGRLEIKRVEGIGPPLPLVRSVHYQTFRMNLRGGEAAVLSRLHAGSTRRGIRKAEKEGVQVRRAVARDDWRIMADLEERTAREHGVPPPPRTFFLTQCAGLQQAGIADLYLAEHDGRALAGIVVWKGPRRWIYAFGASRPEMLGLRPNHALLWTAIREAIVAGVEFDLGRAAPEQASLTEFKRRWGGEPVPLVYDYWPAPGGLNTKARDRGPLKLAADLWRRLPLGITRAGSALYRYLG